jgi:hypothetical protein
MAERNPKPEMDSPIADSVSEFGLLSDFELRFSDLILRFPFSIPAP